MTVHVFLSGRVQGVGFRRNIKHQADKLRVTGWVKNLPDRRVEIMASGKEEKLEKLIEFCKKGPFLAEVSDIQKEKLTHEDFDYFSIIR